MKRSTFRRTVLTLAVVVLAALVVLTAVRFERSRDLARAADRFEETVGPLELEAYAPEPVPDAENAALPVLEALERLEDRADDDLWSKELAALRRQNRSAAEDWSAEEVGRARTLVASRPEALELLGEAAGRSGSSFRLDYAAGPAMEVPNLLAVLHAGDLLFARARLGWLDGRPEEAVRSVESLASLSRVLQGEGLLIFQLVGHAVEVLQVRAIREGLATGSLDRDALRRLRETVGERSRSDRLRRALGVEGSMIHLVRPGGPASPTLFGRRGGLDGLADALVDRERWLDRIAYRWLGHRAVARELDYYAGFLRAFPDLSYAELLERPEILHPPPGDRTRLVVDLEGVAGTLAATEALSRLSRLSLDVALAGAETGALPAELPPTPEAGAGPFTGNRPVYRRAAPGADGSATLSLPGAAELWGDVKATFAHHLDGAELFEWRVGVPPVPSDRSRPGPSG
ncbi:MAG: hypothetical protein PVG07_08860 [Acidobacteriota bacterium]|jgi:hypothetical protein